MSGSKEEPFIPAHRPTRLNAYVECLGCAPNRADGARVAQILERNGWTLVEEPSCAAALVVLTCGFTQQMEDANRKRLTKLAATLAKGSRLFVGGCLPSMATSPLELPEQTFFFSPMTIESLEGELRSLSMERPSSNARRLAGPTETRLIRVSTGCLSHCTFCAIPNAAGQTKSRCIPEIVSELDLLVQSGAQSFLLTSEDVGAYGLDIGVCYPDLVGALLQNTNAESISIDTLNPRWLRRFLPQTIRFLGNKRVNPLLYVPIQSGSDKILQRMARGYTSHDVRYILDCLLRERPDVRLVTDFIVGFPGETGEDFEATRTLLRDYRSSMQYVEVFKYTERPGTAAVGFVDPVPEPVRDQRAHVLLADVLETRFRSAGIGTREDLFSYLSDPRPSLANTNLDVETYCATHTGSHQDQQLVQLRA